MVYARRDSRQIDAQAAGYFARHDAQRGQKVCVCRKTGLMLDLLPRMSMPSRRLASHKPLDRASHTGHIERHAACTARLKRRRRRHAEISHRLHGGPMIPSPATRPITTAARQRRRCRAMHRRGASFDSHARAADFSASRECAAARRRRRAVRGARQPSATTYAHYVKGDFSLVPRCARRLMPGGAEGYSAPSSLRALSCHSRAYWRR